MKSSLAALALFAVASPAFAQSVDPAGAWSGVISTADEQIRIVMRVEKAKDGSWVATSDSPERGISGLAATKTTIDAGTMKLEFGTLGGVYEGKWDDDAKHWNGEWKQASSAYPLKLSRKG